MADQDRDDDEEEQSRMKKVRGATAESQENPQAAARENSSTPLPPAQETEGVKEVTQGVKEVELDTKPETLPESVPLPDAVAGELDAESSSTASTPPPAGETSETQEGDITPAPETAASGADVSVVSDSAAAEITEEQTMEATTDAAEVVAAPADSVTAARPVKKLRAKAKPTPVAEQPKES
jgi:hypothetical protein